MGDWHDPAEYAQLAQALREKDATIARLEQRIRDLSAEVVHWRKRAEQRYDG